MKCERPFPLRPLLLSALSLALAGCASGPVWPELSTLPADYQEEIRERDPRLEAMYERYHPVPGPGLHFRTEVRNVTEARRRPVQEYWWFVSGSW